MTREEANARIAELDQVTKDALLEIKGLCQEHSLNHTIVIGSGYYKQNITIDNYGAFDMWESSNGWDDSGCTIEGQEDWDSSSC